MAEAAGDLPYKLSASAIAGVDEAGRGPLAGPVVVAAVILPEKHDLKGLDDSKKLNEARREALFGPIQDVAVAWRIEAVGVEEIEALNILGATMRGMSRAVMALDPPPTLALVDGNRTPDLPCAARAIVGGDGLEPCISAASVLAKVYRDRLMMALHDQYPAYGFNRHKGYPTAAHLACLERLGPCPEHRRSFSPVRKWIERDLFGTV